MFKELIERVKVRLQRRSHVARDPLLLGLTTKPRVSGKKGCFPTRQHETPQNIYWGPQWNNLAAGKVKQLTLESQVSMCSSILTKPLFPQKTSSSSGGGHLGSSAICFLGRIYILLQLFKHLIVFRSNNVVMHTQSECNHSDSQCKFCNGQRQTHHWHRIRPSPSCVKRKELLKSLPK